MNRQDINHLLSSTGPLASRLYILSKDVEGAAAFWLLVEQLSRERQGLFDRADSTEQRTAVAIDIVHDAFVHLPHLRQSCMAKYLWQLLDDDAQHVFKTTCKHPRTEPGLNSLVAYTDYLERNGVINYKHERVGEAPVSSTKASDLLCVWLVERED